MCVKTIWALPWTVRCVRAAAAKTTDSEGLRRRRRAVRTLIDCADIPDAICECGAGDERESSCGGCGEFFIYRLRQNLLLALKLTDMLSG
jgi:hypothetical protein